MSRNLYGYRYENVEDSSCNYTDENLFLNAERCKAFMLGVACEMVRDGNAGLDEETYEVETSNDCCKVSIMYIPNGTVAEEFTLVNFVLQDGELP